MLRAAALSLFFHHGASALFRKIQIDIKNITLLILLKSLQNSNKNTQIAKAIKKCMLTKIMIYKMYKILFLLFVMFL